MTNKTTNDFALLELQVEKLIKTCDQLRSENTLLRERQMALVAERARLVEKHDLARSRVDSMIVRLRSLEVEA